MTSAPAIDPIAASTAAFADLDAHLHAGVTSSIRIRRNRVMFERGRGGLLIDLDGRELVDCTLAFGPIVIGHSEPSILDAIHAQVDRVLVTGSESPQTATLLERVRGWVPCAERVVFANTGSEAVHLALRIARATTGRQKVLRFEGHFHGWLDPAYTNGVAHGAFSGDAPTIPVLPNGPGQLDLSDELVVARWNDTEAFDAALDAHGGELAAVIMEPVAFNAGGLRARAGYLEHVRSRCTERGILLIFDEVVTGFRLGSGGAQGRFGVTPDLATFAKAASAGIPIAMVAGTDAAMASVADGRVSLLGTYTANPLAVAASVATIAFIDDTPDFYPSLEAKGVRLRAGLERVAQELGVPIACNQTGSVVNAFWGTTGDRDTVASVTSGDFSKLAAVIERMTLHGVYALPRGAFFLCYRHTDADIDRVVAAFRTSVLELRAEDEI